MKRMRMGRGIRRPAAEEIRRLAATAHMDLSAQEALEYSAGMDDLLNDFDRLDDLGVTAGFGKNRTLSALWEAAHSSGDRPVMPLMYRLKLCIGQNRGSSAGRVVARFRWSESS